MNGIRRFSPKAAPAFHRSACRGSLVEDWLRRGVEGVGFTMVRFLSGYKRLETEERYSDFQVSNLNKPYAISDGGGIGGFDQFCRPARTSEPPPNECKHRLLSQIFRNVNYPFRYSTPWVRMRRRQGRVGWTSTTSLPSAYLRHLVQNPVLTCTQRARLPSSFGVQANSAQQKVFVPRGIEMYDRSVCCSWWLATGSQQVYATKQPNTRCVARFFESV